MAPPPGTTPGSVTVGVANFEGLAAGAYNGSITIASSASNSPLVVPVSLTVLAATPLTPGRPQLHHGLRNGIQQYADIAAAHHPGERHDPGAVHRFAHH